MTTQDQSLLMRLPPELRNRIYHQAFKGHETVLECAAGTLRLRMPQAPGILLTCRQVHQEAVGIFYSTTAICSSTAWCIAKWLQGLPENRVDLLSDVRFDAVSGAEYKSTRRVIVSTAQGELFVISWHLKQWRKRLPEGALKARILLQSGESTWTSTPRETYDEQC